MSSTKLTRFGVSMAEDLLQNFDEYINEKGYSNRSEAVRDLVREAIVQHDWTKDEQIVAGSILIFYDHHQKNLVNEIIEIQHNYHDQILGTSHYHIDHHNCLEIIIVKGRAGVLKKLSDGLTTLKGVKYSKLTVSP
ncbi:nickel-responsive transcriptional regulator NikR [Bacillus sp. Marseille-P3661]|uniref:nickel-responsive transcriptional regulator NikR n=1 Tax=Bacillus sp. Marseille-P3661 TaxID=1936234 RepID=UPI000C82DB2C|nr:nickel-responsive transcriptional regulator NikR [Bacillus sp. Marseille-P3661]